MKIKIKLQNGDDCEVDVFESFCTIPYLNKKELIFFAELAEIFSSDNLLLQLPEIIKKNIFHLGKFNKLKKVMIRITDVTAYSILLKTDIREEIFEDFDENKPIMSFETSSIFPYQGMGIYVQYGGDMYMEFEDGDIMYDAGAYENWKERYDFLKNIPENSKLKKIHERKFREWSEIIEKFNHLDKVLLSSNENEMKQLFLEFLKIKNEDISSFSYNLEKLFLLSEKIKELDYRLDNSIIEQLEYWLYIMLPKIRTEKQKQVIDKISENMKFNKLSKLKIAK